MIRTSAPSRTVRTAAAALGVAGAFALAGCAAAGPDAAAGSSEPAHADGTYTADGSYATPEGVESITVSVTLQDDVITDVAVSGDPSRPESRRYQSEFIGGISGAVVGQDIDQIAVSRVAGSSLTSGGFTQAIEQIKSDSAL